MLGLFSICFFFNCLLLIDEARTPKDRDESMTRLIDERFSSVMDECEIVTLKV